MAAPGSAARYYTEEELKKLAEGGLTEEEVAALSDDDIRRIGSIRAQDPLSGKPTVQQYEREKDLEPVPKLTLPSEPSQYAPEFLPPVPKESKGFVEDLLAAATSGGDRQVDSEDPIPNMLFRAYEEMYDPKTRGEKLRAQQDKFIGAHQPMSIYEAAAPSDPKTNAMVAQIATDSLKSGVESMSEFVLNPARQATERPLELGMNLLAAGLELHARIPKLRGLKVAEDLRVAPKVGWGLSEGRRLERLDSLEPHPFIRFPNEKGRIAPVAVRKAFDAQFKTRLADAMEALSAEEKNLNPVQYKKASENIDEMIRQELRSLYAQPFDEGLGIPPSATQEIVGEAIDATKSSEAELELERKLSEQRLRRPPLPRHGEEPATAEGLAQAATRSHEDEVRFTIASATPSEARAVHEVLETKLDDIAELKELTRELGGDPETMTKLRVIEDQISGTQDTIAEVRGSSPHTNRFEAGDVVAHRNGKVYTVESVEFLPGGRSIVRVQDDAGVVSKFHPAWLEPTDELQHVPPGIKVPTTDAEWEAFHGSIPDTTPSPEELASMAQNKAVPGADYVPPAKAAPAKGTKVTTGDGITYEYVGEMQRKGKTPIRYWKADRDMAPGRGKAGSQITEDLIRESGFGVPEEEAAPAVLAKKSASEISSSTHAATASIKLTDALSVAPLGGVLLAGIAQDDKKDPTPKEGSPLAHKSALWAVPAGIFAFGLGRYFGSAPFRTAVNRFVRLDKAGPADLERVFETALSPLFPDRPASGLKDLAPALGTAGGAIAGAFVGSKAGQDEPSLLGGILGGAAGAVAGVHLGNNFAQQFRTDLTYRQLYKLYFTEAAGMSPSALAAKQITRVALEGRIREIKDTAQALDRLDAPTLGIVQSFLSGNTNYSQVPANAKEAARAARQLFDDLSMDLLSSGLVKNKILRDTIQSNIGTYVPRLLLRYELDDSRGLVEGWLRSQGRGWGYVSSKNYLKAKKDIPPAVLKALGEITDNPGYLLAKRGVITAADIEQARYHRLLMASPENVMPRKFVLQQKKIRSFQEAMRAGSKGVKAKPSLIKGAGGSLMNEPMAVRFHKAESGMEAAEWQGRTYLKMPDNPRYGLVRGQFVEQAVASDIIATHETTSGLGKLWNAPLSAFKFFKAVMNPASQIRNIVSNAIFADLEAGIAPWRVDKWSRGMNDLASKGKWYKQAVRDGVFGGEFTTSEIEGLLLPHMERATSVMGFVGETVPKFAQKPVSFFAKWHQSSEAWARITVYRHAVESLGLDGPAAAAFARRAIPDYQDVPRWLKVVRTSPFGAPFISFSYKALPRSLEAAVAFGDPKKMMRFWKYPFAMAALNEYAAQKFGLLGKDENKDLFGTLRRLTIRTLTAGMYTPDSYDTFRKYLPNHVGNMQLALPWRDQYDRPNYLDGTFFLPWGDAGEMGKGDFARGVGIPFFPRQLEPTNPWFQLGVAGMTGKDSFTGRDIIPAGSVGIEAFAGWAKFLTRAWGPSLFPGAGYSAEALSNSFSGKFDTDPYVKSKTTAVVSELLGGRTRPVDPKSAYRFKYYDVKKELESNMSELRRLIPALAKAEDLTSDQVKQALATRPSAAASRALRRRLQMYENFAKTFPPKDLPDSPEKLIEAIRKQNKKK